MAKGDQEDNADSLNDWEYPDERDTEGGADSVDLAVCPYCRKMIAEQAEVCPHCGNYITREETAEAISWWMWAAVIVLVLAVVVWAVWR
jgi:RNA polymerase subunit RPABC4/transcription elongation factor Spt4